MRPLKATSLGPSRRIASTLHHQPGSSLQIRAFLSNQTRNTSSSSSSTPLHFASTLHKQPWLGRRPSPLRTAVPQLPAAANANHHLVRSNGSQRHFASQSDAAASAAPAAGELQKTCLTDFHIAHGGKMVPFAGFSMPVLYSDQSLTESHLWTRSNASIFDVSHMVQQFFRGPKAGWFLERVTPSCARSMQVGTGMLSALMLEDTGGMVDDCLVSRIGEEDYYVVTNAGRREEDAEFIRTRMFEHGFGPGGPEEGMVQWGTGDGTGMIAVQGPEAVEAISRCVMLKDGAPSLDEFWFGSIEFGVVDLGPGEEVVKVLVSRGGYTGEDGFEIGLIDPEKAPRVVETLLRWGNGRVKLAGLGARDSLRLEAGMCLYGHDLDETVTPVEAGLGWIIPRERREAGSEPPFPGKERILAQLKSRAKGGTGVERRRVGLVVEKGPPAREGASIVGTSEQGQAKGEGEGEKEAEAKAEEVGVVTSGCPSPSTGLNIAMAYVNDGSKKVGTELKVLVRGRERKAVVTKMPFVEAKYYKP